LPLSLYLTTVFEYFNTSSFWERQTTSTYYHSRSELFIIIMALPYGMDNYLYALPIPTSLPSIG